MISNMIVYDSDRQNRQYPQKNFKLNKGEQKQQAEEAILDTTTSIASYYYYLVLAS